MQKKGSKMKHIKLLASLLSFAITAGTCLPVNAENLISENQVSSEERSDSSYSDNSMEIQFSDEEISSIENAAISENRTDEDSGYARSGKLKYDDQNSGNFSIRDKRILMDLGEVRKIDHSETASRISWESSRPDIVQVDANGYLIAVASGKAKISGWYNGKKKKITVRVKGSQKTGNLNSIEKITSVGKRLPYPKISKINKTKLVVSSNNPSVIRVDSNKRKLEAASEGSAIINYSYDYSDKKGAHKGEGSILYYVENPLVSENAVEIAAGETRKLAVSGIYGGKQKWTSSNKKTVFVDEFGVVTGLKEGTATIKLRAGGKKFEYKVNVSGKADFYDKSKDIKDYSILKQNRFITLHFYSSGKYYIEQTEQYKNIDFREFHEDGGDKKKSESENKTPDNNYPENPTEENPTEEIPTEEIPSEENPTEEIPTEEIPSEENPTDEKPSEEYDTDKIHEEGDIKYCYIKKENGYEIKIIGLSEKGKKSEIITIPEKINGYMVTEVSETFLKDNHAECVVFEGNSKNIKGLPDNLKGEENSNVYYILHKYTVIHEKENLDGSYSEAEREVFNAAAGKKVVAEVKNNELYNGFEIPDKKVLQVRADDKAEIIYRYKRKIFGISLHAGRGIEKIEGSGKYKYGANVSIRAITKKGYHFKGWSGNVSGWLSEKFESSFSMPAENVDLRADAIPVNYAISYDLSGGKFNCAYPKSYTTESENIIIPKPEKEGYLFAGWMKENSDKVNPNEMISKGSYSDIHYLAKWKARKDVPYTIYYELEKADGSGFESKETVTLKGETGNKVLAEVKEYEGFESPDEEYIIIKANGKSSVTYRYNRKEYDLEIVYKNGTVGKNTKERVKFGRKILISKGMKKGYGNLKITDNSGKTVSSEFAMPAGNLLVNVEAKAEEYTINYDLSSGSMNNKNANPVKYNVETESFVLEPPVRNGYTFSGWTGSNGNKPQQYVKITKGVDTGNKNYKANWSANVYKITFNANGGNGTKTKELSYGSEIGTLPAVTREEFDFLGWYDAAGNKISSKTKVPAGNVSYVAKWEAKKYDLVIDANGGTWNGKSGKTIVKNSKGTVIKIPDPVNKKFKFKGWKFSGDGKFENSNYTYAKAGGTLTATWGDYEADADEFTVGKVYFQNDLKVPAGRNWYYSGFKCVDANYRVDGKSKGYLFIANTTDGCPVIYNIYGKKDKNHIPCTDRINNLDRYLNNEFYNSLSEDLRSKIATTEVICGVNNLGVNGTELSNSHQKDNDIVKNRYYVYKTKIFIPSYSELKKYQMKENWSRYEKNMRVMLLRDIYLLKRRGCLSMSHLLNNGKLLEKENNNMREFEVEYDENISGLPVFVIKKK